MIERHELPPDLAHVLGELWDELARARAAYVRARRWHQRGAVLFGVAAALNVISLIWGAVG